MVKMVDREVKALIMEENQMMTTQQLPLKHLTLVTSLRTVRSPIALILSISHKNQVFAF